MSPGDLGQLLKPFVFLDHFDLHGAAGGTELHPHSGIATVTYLFEGSIRYEDSNGETGVVPAGGVEWFKAAHGAWHAGGPGESGRARGFQLWLALPAEQELGTVEIGNYSVHTTPASLRAGEQRLQEIQRRLQSEGRL